MSSINRRTRAALLFLSICAASVALASLPARWLAATAETMSTASAAGVTEASAVTNTATEKIGSYRFETAAAAALPSLSGTKSVCPSGCDYQTITATIADIQAQGLGGALVLELASTYVSTSETFPLTFTNLTGASATNTVTLRPASGATNLAITSGNTATVNLDNANFVTIDGRAGGAGTSKDLTIENTALAGAALRFINDASNNTVKYAVLKGVTTSGTSGVVLFSTTTGANGNDNDTIDNCEIRDGATTPTNAIYSLGTTATTVQNNSGNTVSNCNVFNFYAATENDSAGVRLDGGNTDWTITGNSFYQTTNRSGVGSVNPGSAVRAVYVNNVGGNNFTVANNFIGGGAPTAGAPAWTISGTAAIYRFVGIQLNVGSGTPSNVQGNTVKNFSWLSTSLGLGPSDSSWNGIYVVAGLVNIGTTTGNTIGSGIGTGSVSVVKASAGPAGVSAFGIACASNGTVMISNNTIGSITTSGSGNTISASLVGIQVTDQTVNCSTLGHCGNYTISNNTVGSTTTANSLNASNSSNASTAQQVTGIVSSSVGVATITGNTVANLNNNYATTGALGQIRGIVTSSGANTITGNTVRNLSTSSRNQNANTQSVFGIAQISTTPGQTVSQNVVHSLSNTAAAAAVSVTGIYYLGTPSGGTNLVARNLVHSLSVSSTSASSGVNGIYFANGTFTAQNNMVRLGIDASGISTAGASRVFGILDIGNAENRNFYHNSVYVGGTQTSGTAGSAPFLTINTSNARTLRNNIFVNVRSNSGGTGTHYAVVYGDVTFTPPFSGLTSDNNIFYSNGTGAVLGLYNGENQTTMQAWRAASGLDASSAFIDPLFLDPTAGTPDLHLQASNPAESGGLAIVGVTADFDGKVRSALTPTDIGADAGNFSSSSGDIYAPVISYTPLAKGSTVNRILTDFATIVDNSGVVSGGANRPRLYFKKSTDADAFVGNTSLDNGWKFATATNSTSPYSFVIDYSVLFSSGAGSGSVAGGDTVQYFIVAQDDANNLSSNPAGAGSAANPPVQNVNAKPGLVNSYPIIASISGTKTVCAAGPPTCDYVNLTGANGIFADINTKIVTSNLTINIAGNLIEDGANGLNQVTSNESPQPTVTIQPADGALKTISGFVSNGMIRLNGADRISIDGRFNGTGRFLLFRNTHNGNATISLLNDASNNTIRSSVIEGGNNSEGVVVLGLGQTTGNDNNTVTDNVIRDRTDAAGMPRSLVYSSGISGTVANSGNVVSNNDLSNFTSAGINIVSGGNESWTVQGNTIYQSAGNTNSLRGIYFTSNGTNTITQNTIRDLNTSSFATGITLVGAFNTTVSNNRIYSFPSTPGSTSTLIGIEVTYSGITNGSITLVNNQITIIPSFANDQRIQGILDNGGIDTILNAYYNSVLIGGSSAGPSPSWACLRTSQSALTTRNNICFNNRTGTGRHFAAGNQSTAGSFSSNYNLFVGTGSPPSAFMDFGTLEFGTPVSFATWQSSTGGDANSESGNPGGSFTAAMFVNPAVGNLRIVAAGNPLISDTGTPVAGITTDYENETRSANTPDVGSDEFDSNIPDTTPPIVTSIDDGDADNAAPLNFTMTYTVVFDEDMDAATVTASDFANAGTATITFGTIIETSPGVFSVQVTPITTGTVILHILAGTSISDLAGNILITPVSDNDTVTVSPILNLTVNTLGDAADVTLDGNCDTDTGTAGSQCTLRAAIQETNNRPSDDIIDFSLAPNSTITLNSALDPINGNLVVKGPGASLLNIRRSTSGGTPSFRIFTINSGKTVTLTDLTVSNGNLIGISNNGGGVLNQGTLTMTNCNIFGNSTEQLGGGISNEGLILTLNDCNVGGTALGQPNTSTSGFSGGGGVYSGAQLLMTGGSIVGNVGNGISIGRIGTLNGVTITDNTFTASGAGVIVTGTANIINSLIARNTSGNKGGGIYASSGTTNVANSTVSGNRSLNDSGGGVTSFTGNVILTNVTITNNRSATAGAGIEVLGEIKLNNTIVAGNFRGASPSTIADDIWGPVNATSSNNLIGVNVNLTGISNGSNGNQIGTQGAPINPLLSLLAGNGGSTPTHALLLGSPALDAGNNSFVTNPPFTGPPLTDQRGAEFKRIVDGPDADTTETVDIGAYERQAVFPNLTDASTNEDTPLIVPFEIDDSASITSVTATSSNTALVPNNPANIMVTNFGSTWLLTVNPAANLSGVSEITVTVNRTGGSTNRTFTLTVNPVNDPPSFTKGPNQTVAEDSGAQVVPSWATSISAGPADESGQILTFQVTGNTNSSLFSAGPAISSTGTLTYTPAANANGSATITIRLTDNSGGADASTSQSFVITVTEINDVPTANSETLAPAIEDVGTIMIPFVALLGNDSRGAANESGQTLVVKTVSNAVGGTVSIVGADVQFTTTANYNGPASFNYTIEDNGTTNGVADPKTSGTATASFNITEVADTPSVTNANTNANTQTTSGLVISRNPADGDEVTHFKITGITGGSLFKNNGTSTINNGDFITFAEGNAGLKFTPGTTNGSFMVQASLSASDAGLGGGTVQAAITVNPIGGVLRFSSGNYSVAEGAGSTTITVERSGDTSRAATVDYASSDHSNPADFIPCTSPGAGFASSRCDFTTAIGTLRFAAGETSKTFNVLISQDNYVEGPETLDLTLSNPTGGAVFGVPAAATLEITDDATEPATNPIDNASEFVRSQYHDFLAREPDGPGLAFWTDNIEKCNDPARRPAGQTVAQCIDKQRESTAVAFFSSPEFQMTGGFVYRLYKGSLTGVPNYDGGSPGRFPTSLEFMRDVSQVSEGIVVNNQIAGAGVEANRNRLAAEFVQRPEFVAKYGGLNHTLYVQELFNTTGIVATTGEKQALVDGLTNGTETRASVLRKVVDGTVVINEGNVQFTTTYGQAFYDQEYRRVFVFMEYVGYLRRNPDAAGFIFWLGKLNQYNGDPFLAEMVRSFILSPEYRSRFGQP